MALIKGQSADKAAKDAVVLDLSDIAQQAEKLKQDAQAKADRLIAEAEQRAAELTEGADERGYAAGYERGYEAGRAEGQQTGHTEALQKAADQLQQLQQAWTQALQQWERDSQWLQQQARDGVVDLAVRLAEKVVHREIAVDSNVIASQLAHGLSHVMRPLEVTARVHPDDKPLAEEAMPELLERFPQVRQLHLVEDEQLTRGGCQLDYGQGGIDLSVEKQLDRMVNAIRPGSQAGGSASACDDAATDASGEATDEQSEQAATAETEAASD